MTRGGDISYVPVVLSYLVLRQDACIWFVQEEALCERVKTYLKEHDIEWRPYGEFYSYLEQLETDSVILLDKNIHR